MCVTLTQLEVEPRSILSTSWSYTCDKFVYLITIELRFVKTIMNQRSCWSLGEHTSQEDHGQGWTPQRSWSLLQDSGELSTPPGFHLQHHLCELALLIMSCFYLVPQILQTIINFNSNWNFTWSLSWFSYAWPIIFIFHSIINLRRMGRIITSQHHSFVQEIREILAAGWTNDCLEIQSCSWSERGCIPELSLMMKTTSQKQKKPEFYDLI